MKLLLMLGVLLAAAPAMACDCKPGVLSDTDLQRALDHAAERTDETTSCERARMLGELQDSTNIYGSVYGPVHAEYEHWLKRCERFLESEIDRAWPSGGGE